MILAQLILSLFTGSRSHYHTPSRSWDVESPSFNHDPCGEKPSLRSFGPIRSRCRRDGLQAPIRTGHRQPRDDQCQACIRKKHHPQISTEKKERPNQLAIDPPSPLRVLPHRWGTQGLVCKHRKTRSNRGILLDFPGPEPQLAGPGRRGRGQRASEVRPLWRLRPGPMPLGDRSPDQARWLGKKRPAMGAQNVCKDVGIYPCKDVG